MLVWAFFALPFFGIGMKTDLFQFWLSFIKRGLSFSHLTLLKKSLSVTRWCWKHWWNYTNWKGAPIFLEVQGQNNLAFSEKIPSVQFSSVAQSCLTLCDPMNCSTPGLPVHHQLPEFTQTPVHRVGDAIQPSHPLPSPSPPAPSPSQHQGLFQWVNSSPEVAKVLEFQL